MTKQKNRDQERIRARQSREDYNVFSRLPAVYAASRRQGQRFLEIGGGLSILEWRTLWDLHEVGAMTIRDLATIQRTDHSLISRALPSMVKKGYITMERDTKDGRQTIVDLTPIGQEAYAKAAPIMAQRRASLKNCFSDDEIKNLVYYLDKLENYLRISPDILLDENHANLPDAMNERASSNFKEPIE